MPGLSTGSAGVGVDVEVGVASVELKRQSRGGCTRRPRVGVTALAHMRETCSSPNLRGRSCIWSIGEVLGVEDGQSW